MNLYFEKALYLAKYNGIVDPEKQIRETLWSDRDIRNQKQNLSNVLIGKTKATPELIQTFCEVCNVSPTFIFYGKDEEI